MFIKEYKLMNSNVCFTWGEEQEKATQTSKDTLVAPSALGLLDCASAANVVLAIDISCKTVGFHILSVYQDTPKMNYHACFGLILSNKREAR